VLRARAVDVLTVSEAALTGEADDVVLAHVARDGRALYSFNTGDFCRLHTEYMQHGEDHAGIILVPYQRYSVGEQLRRLFQLMNTKSAEQMRNTLEFL
jgi:hypothetical protein